MTTLRKRIGRPYLHDAKAVASLPFTVAIAETTKDIADTIKLRAAAYGRHLPDMAKALSAPEPIDLRSDCVLLVARSKETGEVIGSMRLNCNLLHRLQLEQSLSLPADMRTVRLLEARRLTIANGEPGRMVAPALIKAAYEYSYRAGIDYALVTARRPVDRMYRMMQFHDLLGGETVALKDVANLKHSVYCMPIEEADARWRQAQCPMYEFMAGTRHPDIRMDHVLFERRVTGSDWKWPPEQVDQTLENHVEL